MFQWREIILVTLIVKHLKKNYIVEPLLRGHHCDKEKVAYKTGDLLKDVQIIKHVLGQGQVTA